MKPIRSLPIWRLAGITRAVEGYLWVRNRIYYRVFDQDWILANLPDAEKRRQREAYHRGALRAGLVAALIVIPLVSSIAFYIDANVVEHISYYKEFDKKYGVFEGIGPISFSEVSPRQDSYRFIKKGPFFRRRVERVEAINSLGEMTKWNSVYSYLDVDTDNDPACQWKLVYGLQGNLVFEEAKDSFGKLVRSFVYFPQQEDVKISRHAMAIFVGAEGYPKGERSSPAQFVEITYDGDGNETRRLYKDQKGDAVPGPDHAYGLRNTYTDGVLMKTQSLREDGQTPMVDRAGNCALEFAYQNGLRIYSRALDAGGQPTYLNRTGHCIARYEYDSYGNMANISYFDTDNKPMLIKAGYHSLVSIYQAGKKIQEGYLDLNGHPVLE